MQLPRVLIVLLAFAVAHPVAAEQTPAPEDIDSTYQACLDNASGNLAMITCTDTAASAWDKILNANYKAASAALDDKNRKLLREAQRKWLHYRDADQAFRDSDWSTSGGLDMKLFLAEARMQIVKARAQVLSTYAPMTE